MAEAKTTSTVAKAKANKEKTVRKASVTKEMTKPVVKVAKTVTTKTTAAKPTVTKEVVVTASPAKKTTKNSTLTLNVFGVDGKVVGSHTLAVGAFGVKVNKQLIAQAVRVYLANQRQGNASTKSRNQVTGSTRKIYRQKGTGRARHGGITAPIFVGGGVAHGPKPHDFSLNLPQRMKQAALASALTGKAQDQEVKIVTDLEKLEGKTKKMFATLTTLGLKENKKAKTLLIVNDGAANTIRAARNLDKVTVTSASRLNVYDVLTTKYLLFTQEALTTLENRFMGATK